jgi:hypothetical protein
MLELCLCILIYVCEFPTKFKFGKRKKLKTGNANKKRQRSLPRMMHGLPIARFSQQSPNAHTYFFFFFSLCVVMLLHAVNSHIPCTRCSRIAIDLRGRDSSLVGLLQATTITAAGRLLYAVTNCNRHRFVR